MEAEISARLVGVSVEDFVSRVASTEAPVPAGGSVAALTGACAAALLALACGVLAKREVHDAEGLRARASRLQTDLLALVDEDAAAYAAFLEAKRDAAAIARVSRMPLRLAELCGDVADLADDVATRIGGAVAADVRAARRLAESAREAALELSEANLTLQQDAATRAHLRAEIERLRG